MFAAVSHLWPWYLVWGIAFGAMLRSGGCRASSPASRSWCLSCWRPGGSAIEPYRDVATIGIYAGAALWVVLTREPHDEA